MLTPRYHLAGGKVKKNYHQDTFILEDIEAVLVPISLLVPGLSIGFFFVFKFEMSYLMYLAAFKLFERQRLFSSFPSRVCFFSGSYYLAGVKGPGVLQVAWHNQIKHGTTTGHLTTWGAQSFQRLLILLREERRVEIIGYCQGEQERDVLVLHYVDKPSWCSQLKTLSMLLKRGPSEYFQIHSHSLVTAMHLLM